MNLKKAYNILLFWLIVFSVSLLLILVFAEYNVINDDVFTVVFIAFIFLLFSSLALIDKICCKFGKKIYYSDLIDEQVRKRLLDYFVKENFTCKKYGDNEASLPFDQHELIALIAPRPVYVASASQDLWADPKGEMLGLVNAVPVYELYGYAGITIEDLPPENTPVVSDIMGYHLREGKHDVLLYDWEQYVAFADRFLK